MVLDVLFPSIPLLGHGTAKHRSESGTAVTELCRVWHLLGWGDPTVTGTWSTGSRAQLGQECVRFLVKAPGNVRHQQSLCSEEPYEADLSHRHLSKQGHSPHPEGVSGLSCMAEQGRKVLREESALPSPPQCQPERKCCITLRV